LPHSVSSGVSPHLEVRVVRSPDIGVIGVGEGTTQLFPKYFFDQLRLKPAQFYAELKPTWKLGIRFHLGTAQILPLHLQPDDR
jgi:tryptophan halogenase